MDRKTVVIKYGGHAMDDVALRETFIADVADLFQDGIRFVIVHGGGPMINMMLERLQIKSEFSRGLRITSDAVLEVVEMVLCGKVNKAVVRWLATAGISAAGISGEDGNLFEARPKEASLGHVGEITKVNPALVENLLSGGFVPVVAPLALDAGKQLLNVNADTAAGALAGAMKADFFILVSDVPGILDKEGQLFSYLTENAIADLCKTQTISGGMLPKTEACIHALHCGCKSALILDGRQKGSLKKFLLENAPLGTTINL